MSFLSGIGDAFKSFTGGLVDTVTGGLLSNYFNKKAEKRQYQRDLDMWNKTNEYNNPASQMERLRQAGLNPQLAIDGISSSSAASLGGSSSIGTQHFSINPIERKMVNAQIDNMKSKIRNEDKAVDSNIRLNDSAIRMNDIKASLDKKQIEYYNAMIGGQHIANSINQLKLDSGFIGDDQVSQLGRTAYATGSKFMQGLSDLGKYFKYKFTKK